LAAGVAVFVTKKWGNSCLDSPLETDVQSCYKNEVRVGEPMGATLKFEVIKPNSKADVRDDMLDAVIS